MPKAKTAGKRARAGVRKEAQSVVPSTPTKKKSSAPKKQITATKPENRFMGNLRRIPRNSVNLAVPQRKTVVGEVFVFGNGDCGQLGAGQDILEAIKPKKVQLEGIVDVVAGGLHNMAITQDGKVYSWGCNDQRALGRDGEETEPGLVQGLDGVDIVRVAAGDCWSAALDSNGKLYTWGTFRNETGIFGYLPGKIMQNIAALFEPLAHMTIVDVAGGSDHILALNTHGEVFTWGNGRQHQLGRRVVSRREEFTSLIPEPVGLRRIVKVNAGAYHSFALDQDGDVFIWGLNNFGQCAVNAPADYPIEPRLLTIPNQAKLQDVTGGEHHSIALTTEGDIYTWGRSDSHQLGLGYTRIGPDGKPDASNLASSSSSLDTGSKSMINAPQRNPHLRNIVSISANNAQCVVTDKESVAYSWGYGEAYHLGNRESQDEEVPHRIQTGEGTKILVTSTGSQHTVLLALRNRN